tara:strand:+ start:1619 stop:3550 length:1932 start_codon:yes stop_codon:yes gene_type:complete
MGPVLLDHEIAEERSVEHLDRKVLAPGGVFIRVTHVCKTVPMEVWRLETTAGHAMECAGKHLVVVAKDIDPVPVDQLRRGDLIVTDQGFHQVSVVENTGEVRALYDLRVDSEDHLYITDGIVSHNSTGLGAAELFKFNIFPNYRSIYLTPLKEHSKTIADTMLNLQRGSLYPPEYYTSRGYRNNMYYKESPKGGSIKLLHILTDPTKIRGNSVPSVVIDEAQDFDPEHLPEIEQVQKSFRKNRTIIFAGTSKDLDTCLEAQYRLGSMGVWHIPCGCKDKFHPLDDPETIPAMMSVDGLRCPNDHSRLLNPMGGSFVHANRAKLNLNMPSFHLPQVIVPQYARGAEFSDIWKDFKRYDFKKFLTEVWGIAVDSGLTELTETDVKKCCTDKTFSQTQADYLNGKVRYVKLFSGVDWGGSDWEPAYRSKLSYTVHTIWGMRNDGTLDLVYAHRYSGMNYRDISGTIVAAHNKYKTFAMGTDNGGGQYYNAYMRDCGRIPTNLIVHFQYTDTKLVLDRIPHPEAHIMSLHRSDSISALIADIKDQKVSWPRWDDSAPFVLDCLNIRRNITETNSGRTILRYIKHGAKADDFMMSMNYAAMMKRVVNRESLIPNSQVLDELAALFGLQAISQNTSSGLDMLDGGYVSG